LRHDDVSVEAPSVITPVPGDRLARELARCRAIGMAAKDDVACEAAWAENRRRFFTYQSTERTPSPSATEQRPAAQPEDK
jgi:conjugative transfer region protein TrbK